MAFALLRLALRKWFSLHGASVSPCRGAASAEHPVTLQRRSLEFAGGKPASSASWAFDPASTSMDCVLPRTLRISGHQLPPLDQSDESWARTLLMCPECGKKLIFARMKLSIEFSAPSAPILRVRNLRAQTSHGSRFEPTHPAPPDLAEEIDNASTLATRMKAMACIQESGATMTSLRS